MSAAGASAHLHVHSEAADHAPLLALLERIRDRFGLTISLTRSTRLTCPAPTWLTDLGDSTLTLPENMRADMILHHGPVQRFDHLRGALRLAKQDNVPFFLTDFGTELANWRMLLGGNMALRELLTHARFCWVSDAATQRQIVQLGIQDTHSRFSDPLSEAPPAPPCDEARRQTIARSTGSRPSWLASDPAPEEISAVITAHGALRRRAHNLLLIITLSDLKQIPNLRERLSNAGFTAIEDGEGIVPGRDTDVVIANAADDGLWHRIAPACFLGRTLCERDAPLPWAALTLGSAMVHGPHTKPHEALYKQADALGAARRADTADALIPALGTALAPDHAADMAAAGWRLASRGADLTNEILDHIAAALEDS
ncbi:hypothetical protein ACMA5I_14840 [Paracoccaceae bacterium GXU_MW_L88]